MKARAAANTGRNRKQKTQSKNANSKERCRATTVVVYHRTQERSRASSSRRHVQSVTTDRIQHPVDPHIAPDVDVRHILGCDENILLVRVCSRSGDLEPVDEYEVVSFTDKEPTIIFILIRRLIASIKTSNSSRQRRGHPIESQSESRRQIVEKDFSPPLSDLGSLSAFAPCVFN